LALILGFTLAMAESRIENRKVNLIEAANCIKTAALSADIYPNSIKTEFKKNLEFYLQNRKNYYQLDNVEAILNAPFEQMANVEIKLWKRAVFYAKDKDYFMQSTMMLPALNAMFDIVSKSKMVLNSKVPETIVYLSLIFSVIISFFIGLILGYRKKLI
jgi:hypothetical protein